MKIILLIVVLGSSIYCEGQSVYVNRDRLLISDTSCFYNKNYYRILSTKHRKIDLSKLYQDSVPDVSTGIKINSNVLVQLSLNEKIEVQLANDNTSIYPSWSLSIDMKDNIESYSLIPIFCDNNFLIFNVIGVKKLRRNKMYRGYLRTLVYRVG